MNRESSASAHQSAPDLSVEAIAHGVRKDAFVVPHHVALDKIHELHVGGKLSDKELRQQLNSFFAYKAYSPEQYEDQIMQSCAAIAPVVDQVHTPDVAFHTASQIIDFLADPSGFSSLQTVIEERLAGGHASHENLAWLEDMDTTLSKMRSLITVLKYAALRQSDVTEHFGIHKDFDGHHDRLRNVHAHVRAQIKALEPHREKLIKSQIVDQNSPHVTRMGHKIQAHVQYMDELSPVIAPGTPDQKTILANPQKPQHPYQRSLHHQAFAKIMTKMRTSNNNIPVALRE